MTSEVRALNDLVLIEPISEETKTKTGIIILETVTKRKPKKGIVVKADSAKVTVGEMVLYPQGHATEVSLDGKNYDLLKATELWLVI